MMKATILLIFAMAAYTADARVIAECDNDATFRQAARDQADYYSRNSVGIEYHQGRELGLAGITLGRNEKFIEGYVPFNLAYDPNSIKGPKRVVLKVNTRTRECIEYWETRDHYRNFKGPCNCNF